MISVVLSERLFAKLAGWEAVKQARPLVVDGRVLSSDWTPPILKGAVQDGPNSYRSGLVIKSEREVENICTCRASRKWGTICAHSVAVGLHFLRREQATSEKDTPADASSEPRNGIGPGTASANAVRRDPAGEPAELHLIFPPGLDQAIARGNVMVVLEASWRDRRTPLNALPKTVAFAFSPHDVSVLERIEWLTGGETPAMVIMQGREFGELLPTLVGHPRLTLGKSIPVEVGGPPWSPSLTATLETNGEITLKQARAEAVPAVIDGGWIYRQARFLPLSLPASYLRVFREPIRIPRAEVPDFVGRIWPQLEASGGVEANFRPTDITLRPELPHFHLELKGGLAQLQALIQCSYGARILRLGDSTSDERIWLPDAGSPTTYAVRDPNAERAALGRLIRAGFTGPDAHGRYQLVGQERVLDFLAREFPKLQREWQVNLEERLARTMNKNLERLEPRIEVTSSGIQWFDLAIRYDTRGGERFSAADIQRLILSGRTHTRLRTGRFALIDPGAIEELQETLFDCSPEQFEGRYRLKNHHAGFIAATVRDHIDWSLAAPEAWRDRVQDFNREVKPVCPPLGGLEPVLRSYQKTGVGWLHFLRENGFGGILADEMGLGKTLQVLAHFCALHWTKRGRDGEIAAADGLNPRSAARCPHLIVCPTSLVFNWLAEARKFTPALRVLALSGLERHRLFAQIPSHDLIITSYASIRRDVEEHRKFEFDTMVLDEAQHIKNRRTQNAQAVKGVRARHRLVLTGTPLENSVLDLWSIFDFLMPGYLGSAGDFHERYERPITRDRDTASQSRLARRLRPFILRRLKREVAQELPEKIEQVSYCELTDGQREIYEKIIEASRKEVSEAIGAKGEAKSRIIVLNALLRLRQACCDARLLGLDSDQAGADPSRQPAAPSGKVELFAELLEEVLDGGHRVLVFSQFVSMLMLLQKDLAAQGIDYCYLDGATRDRAGVVSRFQSHADIPVFLISLKAGGVGLNLTGADTVIHFDPWWNPAVEDQATDRAHRIGQARVVTSYKLITRGTVEEKILMLQQRKRDLIQATLGEAELAEALTWEEIQELLA